MTVDNQLRKYWLITIFCVLFSVISFGVVVGISNTHFSDSQSQANEVDDIIKNITLSN